MTDFLIALLLLLFAITGVVVRKTYFYIPPRELKRRARQHNKRAQQYYRAVAYGNSLQALLWLWIGLASAGSVLLLSNIAPLWLSLPAVLLLIWLAFAWLPASRTSRFGEWLTSLVTPVVAWLLNYLHPSLSRVADRASKRAAPEHTGLFERQDLLRLIDQQQSQTDNRLGQQELEIAKRALTFDDFKVRDILTPRKKIKSVLATETVGPVLIDELHKNGQPFAVVRETAKGPIVGLLSFNKLSLQSSGQVKDFMEQAVCYVHEGDNLTEVLQAYVTTKQPVFAVIDNHEDYLGVATVDALLSQLFGELSAGEFDQYTDPAAVITYHNRPAETEAEQELEEDEIVVLDDDELESKPETPAEPS